MFPRATLSLCGVLLTAAVVAGCASSKTVGLHDEPVDPIAAGSGQTTVLLFTTTECPIANRYAPEVRRLAERFSAPDTRFWLVYADPADDADAIRRHLDAYDFDCDVVRDLDHTLVRFAGAEVTPEAAVFSEGVMVYRGRIDDRFVDFGKTRPAATRHDLEEVLVAIDAGETVEPHTTTAIGCFIPELP